MADKPAESTIDAIKQFRGDRNIGNFYSGRSGEIGRDLRALRSTADNSQLGVPQNNAVADRLVQDVLEGTRTVLVRVGLLPCVWEYACRH